MSNRPPLRSFEHAAERIKERYGFEVSWSEWSAWCDSIERADGVLTTHIPALNGDRGNEVWVVRYRKKIVFLGVRAGDIRTVLPKEDRFLVAYSLQIDPHHQPQAIAEREAAKSAKRESGMRQNRYDQTELHRWEDDGGKSITSKYDWHYKPRQ